MSERVPADYYPTPSWCTRRLLEALALPAGQLYLEPCAGDGAIVRALKAHDPECGVVAWELHEYPGLAAAGADVLERRDSLAAAAIWPRVDVVLTNPPFSHVEQFVDRALRAAPVVVCLERLAWLCTWGKVSPSCMPAAYILPDRPSFTGDGTANSEYAWFVWGAGGGNRMLARTPLDERRRG